MAESDSSVPVVLDLLISLQEAKDNPRRIEEIYRSARSSGRIHDFAAAIDNLVQTEPKNLVYETWQYRLANESHFTGTLASIANKQWLIAIGISFVLALLLWLLSDPVLVLPFKIPLLAVLIAPIVGVSLIAFLSVAGPLHRPRIIVTLPIIVLATGYVLAIIFGIPESGNSWIDHLLLALIHLPLVVAGAIGLTLVGTRGTGRDIYAFLWKSVEVAGTAGVYGIVYGIFAGLTLGLFYAIGITPNDTILRLLLIGGSGLIPVIAVASVYDPSIRAGNQDMRRGFARILSILGQALLPLSLLVLGLYIVVLPFNFLLIFTDRDTLIVYNALLFGILGLLVVATPPDADAVLEPLRPWLRGAIIVLISLVSLISIHALAAIIYRTWVEGLTINRLTVIGWNTLNIGLLVLLLVQQWRKGKNAWIEATHEVYRIGAWGYLIWGTILLIVSPWILR
jgi:hypothetical protein